MRHSKSEDVLHSLGNYTSNSNSEMRVNDKNQVVHFCEWLRGHLTTLTSILKFIRKVMDNVSTFDPQKDPDISYIYWVMWDLDSLNKKLEKVNTPIELNDDLIRALRQFKVEIDPELRDLDSTLKLCKCIRWSLRYFMLLSIHVNSLFSTFKTVIVPELNFIKRTIDQEMWSSVYSVFNFLKEMLDPEMKLIHSICSNIESIMKVCLSMELRPSNTNTDPEPERSDFGPIFNLCEHLQRTFKDFKSVIHLEVRNLNTILDLKRSKIHSTLKPCGYKKWNLRDDNIPKELDDILQHDISEFYTFMNLTRVKDATLINQMEDVNKPNINNVLPLHVVCENGNMEMGIWFCQSSNIETRDNIRNYHNIHLSCSHGTLSFVKNLHKQGCNINAFGNVGNRPLHLASEHGRLEIVKYILNHQRQLDVPNYMLWRPIHFACRGGHTKIVQYLCKKRCNKEALTDCAQEPLHLACVYGHLKIVKLLCKENCKIEGRTTLGLRPIHLACIYGHLEIVMFLCAKKCNKEAFNDYKERPLHLACVHGYLDIVRFLCEQNCDIEASTSNNYRPIHIACIHGSLEIVNLLCNYNCNIEASILDNYRPIHLACKYGNQEIVRLLCKHSCDIEASTLDKNRPIHLVCIHGHLGIVKVLCEENCDIEASASLNYRPIHLACKHGYLEIVKFLCEQTCDIEASTLDNYKPIHLACRHGQFDIVEYLCQQKCNIETVDMFGFRPIHVAVENGHIDIVRLLCQHSCEIEAFTQTGKSVFDLASESHEIQKLLSDEILKRRLITKILNIKVECEISCDHSFCLENVYSRKADHTAIIGRGNFGCVFKMKDSELDYTFCIKSIYLKPGGCNQNTKHIEFNITKFLRILSHERIVQYFGNISTGQEMFIFMEYVERISLDKHINKIPLSHNKAIQYSKEILEGLKFLHRNKIIHRDIKPQNIMLNTNDHVKLCDFGLSCYLETIVQKNQIITDASSGQMTYCGTPNYMAPELVAGQNYSYPVDIWGLGASVVEMLTGKPPFHRMEYYAILYQIGHIKKIEFVPAKPMSQDMKSFVYQMLCSSPSKRATAENLLELIGEKFRVVNRVNVT